MINAAHDHFVTQTCKKSKIALKILWGRWGEGRNMGPRAEGGEKQIPRQYFQYTLKLIWHIFGIKNCNIKFDIYTIQLVWSKLIKLVSKKWTLFQLVIVIQPSSTFLLSEDFLSLLE